MTVLIRVSALKISAKLIVHIVQAQLTGTYNIYL